MTPSRKQPGMAFWATVVAVVVVIYAASFGPALWLHKKLGRPASLGRAFDALYFPLYVGLHFCPRQAAQCMDEYRGWWGKLADPRCADSRHPVEIKRAALVA